MRTNPLRVLVVAVVVVGLSALALAVTNDSPAKDSPLTAKIVLDRSSIPIGGTISGRVIVENRTSKPVLMMRGCNGGGLYTIGFRAADGYLAPEVFELDQCRAEQSMVAQPGRTVFRFDTRASYTTCAQGGVQPTASSGGLPPCGRPPRGHFHMPWIPAGDYTAVFLASSTWHGPQVSSASLRIVQAG